MSTLAPVRPSSSRAAAADLAVARHPRAGSYVDTDRYQAPARRTGSYVDTDRYQPAAGRTGSYVDTDRYQAPAGRTGSYVARTDVTGAHVTGAR